MRFNSLWSAVKVIWRWGDVQLPIRKPWFRLQTFGAPWPICWEGWLTYASLLVWMAVSGLFFVGTGWVSSNFLLFGWLMPTVTIWCQIVGIKIDVGVRGASDNEALFRRTSRV
jgi:hypothetical protein